MKESQKKIINDCLKAIAIAIAGALVAWFSVSCTVSRAITTSSEYHQKGDTTVVIQSKTVEKYDATKRNY